MGYTELHCHSNFSLLDGASSPEALVTRAKEIGLNGLALTDHDSLAGAVRFWKAAQTAELHAVIGAEVTLDDGSHLTLLAENQHGYANLCRLLTASHLGISLKAGEPWHGKTEPTLPWDMLAAYHEGLLVLSGCRKGALAVALLGEDLEKACKIGDCLRAIFGQDRVWLELQHHRLPGDDELARALLALARRLGLRCVLTNNVHYATPRESRLQDALIAIRHNQSLTEARRAGRLPLNHSYELAGPDALARRFSEMPDALQMSVEIAQRCNVSLDFSQQRLPAFPVPVGHTEFAYLYELCHAGLPRRYPQLKPAVLKQLAHELSIIEQAGLAGYFLTVWDIVRFAREREIRCQGRGSAANSLAAYLLGITSVDPLAHNLLFERFLSADRYTIPDIDLDFAADRREEVIQYVYERYGASHAAMVCNVVTYRARSAVRDLGKALDFPPPVIDRLAKTLDSHSCIQAAEDLLKQIEAADAQPAGAQPPDGQAPGGQPQELSLQQPSTHPLRLLSELLRMIDECPRHLSFHTGGMLITGPPLDEVVPLERATMPGRVVCQWNKDSVEDAGLIKIDLLGLRTLGLLSEAVAYGSDMGDDGRPPVDLDLLPLDDPEIYAMLQSADTIGTFQVESRAQQQMLPRLKPVCFADIVIEVAIVRPGPIQGGAVHPYLRRRAGAENVSYLHPCLEPVLQETLGVLLFQEQAIRVAMVAASFSPGEADMLRRAMSRSRSFEAMAALRLRFVAGAQANGIEPETAEAIFHQLEGFAGYGFCKSHAASFALIAYQTLHLKRYQPAAFYCALLNQQPMGFYSPEVIIGDAKRHGLTLLPPDINRSDWQYTIERPARRLRMGLQTISGLGEQAWERIRAARDAGPFADLRDCCVRTRLALATIADLIRAGALDAFGERRPLLWQLGDIDYRPEELALVIPTVEVTLPELESLEQTEWEYELLGLSPNGQLMRHYRAALNHAGILSTVEVKQQANGRVVRVGGMVAVKQRPPTAKGIVFISLEDELGMLDLVVKPQVYERFRSLLRGQTFVLVMGEVQRASGAISVLVTQAMEFNDTRANANR
jgi:error-prone DNA polymerase